MTIVDTHCHVGLHKYEPVESLVFHMDHAGVDKAVFIQYGGNSDNAYMIESMAAHPGRFQSAMIVEPDDDGSAIRRWAEQGVVGIRLPHASRATGSDPLAQWRTAAELDLVVSAPSRPEGLLSTAFTEVLDAFSDLSIVIEHLAGVGRDAEAPYEKYKRALTLAERPNLTIKLPGFGEFCDVPLPTGPIPPVADMALEAFGADRVMWGSDFPPVSSREGYNNSLNVPLAHFEGLSDTERAAIFGETALRVWRFDG